MKISFHEFLAWEASATDAVLVRGTYVQLVGSFKAGALLGRIVYYYLPSRNGSQNKLRVKRQGHFWIAKTREQWQEEIHLTEKELDKSIKTLVRQELIEKKVYHFAGKPTLHIRLRTENFLELLADRLSEYRALIDEEDVSVESKKPNEQPVYDPNAPTCPDCNSTKVLDEEVDPKKRCIYCLLRAGWRYYFPEKPQPRHSTKSLRISAERRWKDEHFRDNWRKALKISSMSRTCQRESWFNFKFFVKNDEHYQDMLDNWMAWRDEAESQKSSRDIGDDSMRQM